MTKNEFLHEMRDIATVWNVCKKKSGDRSEALIRMLVVRMFDLLDEAYRKIPNE